MKTGLIIALGFMLGVIGAAQAADPAVPAPAEVPVAPAPVVAPAPRPVVEAPKPVERPKPVEKPRPVVEAPKAAEPAAPAPAVSTDTPVAAASSYSLGCLALAFAMLVTGFAAGFIARHLVSRRQLGGMTVRIGTWRGIP
jgi:hypothetical protein